MNRIHGSAATLLLCIALCPLFSNSARALPLLSEAYYDAVGSDNGQSFIEIFAAPGASLDGLLVLGVNGANGSVGPVVALAGIVPVDGLFVVADDAGDGTTFAANADLVANFDFQNGPDSIQLLSGPLESGGGVLDSLAYGVFGPAEIAAGEGAPAPDAPAGSSLARLFANVDTDDNAADFGILAVPTPGVAPLLAIPEPQTAVLVSVGLLALARLGGRAGRRQ